MISQKNASDNQFKKISAHVFQKSFVTLKMLTVNDRM